MERIHSAQQKKLLAWFEKDQDNCPISVEGHLVGRARAGTGKTYIIEHGCKRAPKRPTLVCAFAKPIQEELNTRFKGFPHVEARTLHSVGFSFARQYRERLRPVFDASRADMLTEQVCGRTVPDAIKKVVSKLHTKGREILPHACNLGDLTDLAIRFECEPDQEWERSGFDLNVVEAFALAAMELAANVRSGDMIDGSDMIFLPLRNHWLRPSKDLVVVDEAQDMTNAQLELALGIMNPGGRMAIIGDDRQAIFGWRGADTDSIDRLKSELNAGELGLTTTYRCGQVIVDFAQRLVLDIQAGADNPQGEIVGIHPSGLVDAAAAGDYILSRVNAPLASVAMKLLRKGKRTRIIGKEIGKGLINLVRKLRGRSVPDFLNKVAVWEEREMTRVQNMLAVAEPKRKYSLEAKLEEIRDRAGMLIELAEDAKSIDEITARIEGLFSDNAGVEGMITCSSIHRAKGLEANRVFVLWDTLRNYSLEEQNLEYVAITRAKKTLVRVSEKVQV